MDVLHEYSNLISNIYFVYLKATVLNSSQFSQKFLIDNLILKNCHKNDYSDLIFALLTALVALSNAKAIKTRLSFSSFISFNDIQYISPKYSSNYKFQL